MISNHSDNNIFKHSSSNSIPSSSKSQQNIVPRRCVAPCKRYTDPFVPFVTNASRFPCLPSERRYYSAILAIGKDSEMQRSVHLYFLHVLTILCQCTSDFPHRSNTQGFSTVMKLLDMRKHTARFSHLQLWSLMATSIITLFYAIVANFSMTSTQVFPKSISSFLTLG